MKNLTIKTRLIAFLFLGGLLPIVLITGFTFWFIQTSLQENLGMQLNISAEEIRDEIDREMLLRFQDLKTLSENPNLILTPSAVIENFLKSIAKKQTYYGHKVYYSLLIQEKDGAIVYQHGLRDKPFVYQENTFGKIPYLSKAYKIKDNIPVIDFILPFSDKSGGVSQKILRATMDLRSLSDILERKKLPGGLDREIIIYNENNMIIARKNSDRLYSGKSLDEFSLLEEFNNMTSGFIKGRLIKRQTAMAAVNTFIGLVPPLDSLKWKIAIIQPLDDRSEQTVILIEKSRQGIFMAVLLAIIISSGFSLTLLRSILFPLSILSEATLRIKKGDLSTPIKIESSDELGQLAIFFNSMMEKLKNSLDKLTELATTDGLTNLLNWRVFDEKLNREIKRALRYNRRFSLVILDIDYFKRCNDTHGHAFGDTVLKEIAKICREACRETDTVARYGGEEITFILSETTKGESFRAMERLRASIEAYQIKDETQNISAKVTVSIGIAEFPSDASSAKVLFSLADKALYEAKESGRNKVVKFG